VIHVKDHKTRDMFNPFEQGQSFRTKMLDWVEYPARNGVQKSPKTEGKPRNGGNSFKK
jgi:hypothetical protein